METAVRDFQELRSRMTELVRETFGCDTAERPERLGPFNPLRQVSDCSVNAGNINLIAGELNAQGIPASVD